MFSFPRTNGSLLTIFFSDVHTACQCLSKWWWGWEWYEEDTSLFFFDSSPDIPFRHYFAFARGFQLGSTILFFKKKYVKREHRKKKGKSNGFVMYILSLKNTSIYLYLPDPKPRIPADGCVRLQSQLLSSRSVKPRWQFFQKTSQKSIHLAQSMLFFRKIATLKFFFTNTAQEESLVFFLKKNIYTYTYIVHLYCI